MATYKIISSVTVGSGGAANIEFTGLGSYSSNYTDLKLTLSARTVNDSSAGVTGAKIELNGDTNSANYSYRRLYGAGTGAPASDTNENILLICGSANTASTFGNADLYIPNAYGSTNKSFSADAVTETNATAAYADIGAGLWSNTASLTAIKLIPSAGSFAQYTTAYLYGISNA